LRKLLLLLGLELFVALPLQAQGTFPRAEIFGGYSYLHSGQLFNSNIPKGWNASFTGNVHPNIGIEADFSGHYGGISGSSHDTHLFMAGPKIAARLPKVTPWGHALFGASHVNVEGRDDLSGYRNSRTVFAWAVGAGLDARLHRNLSVRVIQADYVRVSTRYFFAPSGGRRFIEYSLETSNNLRLSFGVVFTFGGG